MKEPFKPTIDLATLLDSVMPQSSLLFKDSGLWDFFRSEEDFNEGKNAISQNCNECAHEFLERVVHELMKSEEFDDEPLTTIDYMIYRDKTPTPPQP